MNSQVGLYTKRNRSRKARAFSQLEAEDKLFESQEPEAGIQMPESRLRLPTDVRLKNPQMWKTLFQKRLSGDGLPEKKRWLAKFAGGGLLPGDFNGIALGPKGL